MHTYTYTRYIHTHLCFRIQTHICEPGQQFIHTYIQVCSITAAGGGDCPGVLRAPLHIVRGGTCYAAAPSQYLGAPVTINSAYMNQHTYVRLFTHVFDSSATRACTHIIYLHKHACSFRSLLLKGICIFASRLRRLYANKLQNVKKKRCLKYPYADFEQRSCILWLFKFRNDFGQPCSVIFSFRYS